MPDLVLGVLDDTFLVGRQYSVLSFLFPHGLPVLVLTHFSRCHRFNDVPAGVFRTTPLAFLHLASCWDALAEGQSEYCRFTL